MTRDVAARLVFCDSVRGLPVLSRGWRTPDPSPTREAGDLPRCSPKQFGIIELAEEKGGERQVMTPRARGFGEFTRHSQSSRTPSPPPVPSACPAPEETPPREVTKQVAFSFTSTSDGSDSGSVEPATEEFELQGYMTDEDEDAIEAETIDGGAMQASSSAGSAADTMWMVCAAVVPMAPAPGFWSADGLASEDLSQIDALPQDCQGFEGAQFCVPGYSYGSIGHPHTCADFCKYHKKAKGCKDGINCNRCHLCTKKKIEPAPPPNRRRGRRS